jgi:hypothetical protein
MMELKVLVESKALQELREDLVIKVLKEFKEIWDHLDLPVKNIDNILLKQ